MTLTRRGRHARAYPEPRTLAEINRAAAVMRAAPPVIIEGTEPPTLVDAKMADRDHDVKAIISAYLAELAQFRPF